MNIAKKEYNDFCNNIYVPIYSKSWWMDVVCGKDNWDVFLIKDKNNQILAAMPYYYVDNGIKKITKPPLTQNNGVLFNYPSNASDVTKYKFEEKIINEVCHHISEMNLDVYEQQYHYSFTNWLPFFWNYYKQILRYTFVIEDTSNLEKVWEKVTSKQRAIIRKGQRNGHLVEVFDKELFYSEHEKVFKKQGLECPFSYELFSNLVDACQKNNACKMLTFQDDDQHILSVMFIVWDEESVYQILGGGMPDYQKLDTYGALIWEGIKFASENGLKYDFEGSVIKRISKAFREFGGKPMPYFRIRKVFNPEIIRREAEAEIEKL